MFVDCLDYLRIFSSILSARRSTLLLNLINLFSVELNSKRLTRLYSITDRSTSQCKQILGQEQIRSMFDASEENVGRRAWTFCLVGLLQISVCLVLVSIDELIARDWSRLCKRRETSSSDGRTSLFVQHLTKSVKVKDRVELIIDDLNIELGFGQSLALFGFNGAGLIRSIEKGQRDFLLKVKQVSTRFSSVELDSIAVKYR